MLVSMDTPEPILLDGQVLQKVDVPDKSQLLNVVYPGDAVTVVGSCQPMTADDIPAVLQSAEEGFERHKKTTMQQRVTMLQKLALLIEAHQESLAKLITLESGKPVKLATIEVNRAQALCQGYANHLAVHENKTITIDGRQAEIQHFPLGPVLAITPFNFPLMLVMHKLAPAIASGCSFTVKPSSKTPLSAIYLGRLAVEAGYTAINIIPCESRLVDSLLRSQVFKKLTFTGSDVVGWQLKNKAGKMPVSLELGGNAACVIEDIPEGRIEKVARRVAKGAFWYSGQICISVQRVFIHQSVYKPFIDALIRETRGLRVGNPLLADTDLGPMITPEDVFRTRELIKQAIAQGANVLYGGNTYNALTMNPTIFEKTTPEMGINAEEVFAPLMTVTPYTNYDEALAMVNDSRYGLQAGVYTQSWAKAQQAFNTLDVGGVIINDVPTTRLDYLPYGGVKDSGLGREGVMTGIAEMSYIKTLVSDKHFS